MRDAVTYIVIWAGDAFWWPYLYTKIASLSKVTWPRIGNYKSRPEWKWLKLSYQDTGKSLSEALIFASTNPKYDDKLFIELQVQYMKIASLEHEENTLRTICAHKLFFVFVLTFRTIYVHNMFWTELVIQWTICLHIVG